MWLGRLVAIALAPYSGRSCVDGLGDGFHSVGVDDMVIWWSYRRSVRRCVTRKKLDVRVGVVDEIDCGEYGS